MVQPAQASVPDRVAATSAPRERIPNTSEHRFAGARSGNRNTRHDTLVHRVADRSVGLRRLSARRRLARVDPESVERRAWRIIGGGGGGGAGSPLNH